MENATLEQVSCKSVFEGSLLRQMVEKIITTDFLLENETEEVYWFKSNPVCRMFFVEGFAVGITYKQKDSSYNSSAASRLLVSIKHRVPEMVDDISEEYYKNVKEVEKLLSVIKATDIALQSWDPTHVRIIAKMP